MPDDLLASPIEPVGNRDGNALGDERKQRRARPPVRERESGHEAEALGGAIEAAEPHELDEMA